MPRNQPEVGASILGGASVTTKENNVVNGQIFFPNAGADLDSTFFGAIYSGDQNVELMANATLNGITPVPERGPIVLISAGFVPFILSARRRPFQTEKLVSGKTTCQK